MLLPDFIIHPAQSWTRASLYYLNINAETARALLEDLEPSALRRVIRAHGEKPKATSFAALLDQATHLWLRRHEQGGDPTLLLEQLETPQEQQWLRAVFTFSDPDLLIPGDAFLHAAAYARLAPTRIKRLLERFVIQGALFLATPVPFSSVIELENEAELSSAIASTSGQWMVFTRLPPVLHWTPPAITPNTATGAALPITQAFERLTTALYRARAALNTEAVNRYREDLRATPERLPYTLVQTEAEARNSQELLPLVSPLTPEALHQLAAATELEAPLVEFLFGLAGVLGLVEPPPQKPPYEVGPHRAQYSQWIALSREEQLFALWTAWQYWLSDWIEARLAIARLPYHARFGVVRRVRPHLIPPRQLGADLCAARRLLVRFLRGLPDETWFDARALIAQLLDRLPQALWSYSHSTAWDFVANNSANSAETRRQAQMLLFLHMLSGPLRWFGAVEVSTDAHGRAEGLRITPLGRVLFEALRGFVPAAALRAHFSEPLAEADSPAITWRDDHTVQLHPPVHHRALLTLVQSFADLSQAPYTFTFTPQSIERGLRQGASVEALAQAFAEQGAPLPQQLSEQLRALAQRVGRVRVYEALPVVEVAEAALLRELLAQPEISQHVLHVLGPTAFAVREEALEEFLHVLQRKGYTPRIA